MAPVLLSSAQISQLLKKLESFGDQSLQVRNVILLHERHPFKQFQVWVDDWPECTTILLKQLVSEIHPYTYHMFSWVNENVEKLLQESDIVEWENAVFRLIPVDYTQMIENVANERGFRVMYSEISADIYKFNTNKFKQRPVPEDVTVGSLTLDMADQVANNWKPWVYHDKKLPHVKYLIRNYPSVCLYDSHGTPIAYEMAMEYGGLGMLFVDPNYRRRGFGKLATNLIVQKSIDLLSYQPFVGIDLDHDASRELHAALGFEKTDTVSTFAVIVPK